MRDQQRGMTLIELMVVVVVVAILAAIAVPSYRSYMIRTQRTEAKTALLQVQAAQEKFYLQNNRYADTMAGLGLPAVTESNKYDIALDYIDEDDQTFRAEATPHAGGGQDDDSHCTKLTINNNGTRGAEGPGGVDGCWH